MASPKGELPGASGLGYEDLECRRLVRMRCGLHLLRWLSEFEGSVSSLKLRLELMLRML